MAEGPLREQVTFETDGSEDQVARRLEQAMTDAFQRAAREIAQAFSKIFKDTGGFSTFTRNVNEATNQMTDALKKSERAAEGLQDRIESIAKDLKGGAFTRNSGLDVYAEQLARAENLTRQVAQQRQEIARDTGLARAFRQEGTAVRTALQSVTTELASLTRAQDRDSQRSADARLQDERSVTRAFKQESAERISFAQIEGARSTAEFRSAAQRRVVLMQAAFGQIRALERGLGTVFSSTARALGSTVSGIGSSVSKMVGHFNRADRELTTGINPALNRRETLIRDSFNTQERIIASSVRQQTVLLDRLDAVSSKGIAGVVSGRSGLGTLLGGGLAIGGGASLFSNLKEGFNDAVNYREQLSAIEVLLGESAKGVQDWAETSTTNLGLTKAAALQAAAGFAGLLRPMGFTQEAAAQTSTELSALAADLASFRNTSVEDALLAIRSGLVGESEPLRRYGVQLSDVRLKAKALELGLSDGKKTLEGNAKATAALALIMEDTALAQGDFIRTSDQFANSSRIFSAQVDQAFSDLAFALRAPATAALKVLIPALGDVINFIKGNVTGALLLLREGLQGAAIALGALLVAKAAGEALQFLAFGLRAVLTPMGLLILGVAAVGAAFKILSKNSQAFRDTIDKLKKNLGDLAERGLALAAEQLKRLGDFLVTSVLPPVQRFVEFLATEALERIRSFAGFLRDTAIPAISEFVHFLAEEAVERARAFADFFQDRVIPRLQEFASFIREVVAPAVRNFLAQAFEKVSSAIRSFWVIAEPILQPAIDGIHGLVEAVQELADAEPGKGLLAIGGILAAAAAGFVVSGPLGAAIGGLGAAVGAIFFLGLDDEITGALKGLGTSVVRGLTPVVESIKSTLARLFTIDNIIDVALIGVGLARQLGRAVGNIVSDPRLLTAIAGFGAFAALAAANFVRGFAEGVVSNLPALADIITTGLSTVLNAGLSAIGADFLDLDVGWLAKALLPVGVIAAAIAAFSKLGGTFNKAIASGFNGPGGGLAAGTNGPKSFIEGLIGGATNDRAIASIAAKSAKQFQAEFERNNRTLSANGKSPIEALLGPGTQTQNLRESRQAIQDLNSELGQSRVAGRLAGDAIGRITSSLKGLDFKGALTGLGDLASVLKSNAKDIGVATGTAIAAGIGVGFGISMVAQSKGIGDTLQGLLTIAGSAATATAVGGPVLGGIALAIGGITAAFQAQQRAAQKAKDEVNEYADALRGIDLSNLDKVSSAGAQTVLENLAEETQNVQDQLIRAGFDAEDFAERVVSGTSTATDEMARFLEGFGAGGQAFAKIVRDNNVSSIEELDTVLRKLGKNDEFARFLHRAGFEGGSFIEVIDAITDETGELRDGLDKVARSDALAQLSGQAKSLDTDFSGFFTTIKVLQTIGQFALVGRIAKVEEAADAAKKAFEEAKVKADEFFGTGNETTLRSALDDFIIKLPNLTPQLDEIGKFPGIVGDAMSRQLQDGITVDVKGLIRVGLESGEVVPTAAGVGSFLTGLQASLQEAVDSGAIPQVVADRVNFTIGSLVADPAALTEALDAAITGGLVPNVNIPYDVTGVLNNVTVGANQSVQAELQAQILAGFGGSVGGPQGFTGGGGAGPGHGARVRGLGSGGAGGFNVEVPYNVTIIPNFTIAKAKGGGGDPAAAGAALVASFASGVAGAAVQAVAAATAIAVATAATFRNGAAAALLGGVLISSSFAAGISSGQKNAVGAAKALGTAASGAVQTSTAGAFAAGVNIAQGLANGIRAGTGAALSAARAMANAVEATVKGALKIASPSLVFSDIGEFIGQGLAQGIADSEDDIEGAAVNAVNAAVKAANGAAQGVSAAFSALFATGGGDAFSAGGSAHPNVAITGLRAGLAALGPQLEDQFRQSAVDLWTAVVHVNEGGASAIESRIAGENTLGLGNQFSLDTNTILGSRNLETFLQLGNSIRNFAEEALASGQSLSDVINQTVVYRNTLQDAAIAAGASSDAVGSYIDQLGLSESALWAFIQQARALEAAAGVPATPTAKAEADKASADADAAEKALLQAQLDLLREQLRVAGIGQAPVEVNVYPPYGDPEAIGAGVANRVMSELAGSI